MVAKLPLVSVIVPCKNSQKFLLKTLNSLKKQSYPNFEVIVVDNFSTDKTPRIAKSFKGLKLRFIQKGPERAAQNNYAVKIAKGKYVFITASDMLFDRSYLEEAVQACENQKFDAIYASVLTYGKSYWEKVRGLERLCYVGDNIMESARFYRRDIFLGLGGWDETVIGNEEDFQTRLDRAGYKTGRIPSREYHLHEFESLQEIFLKTFYYAKFQSSYLKKYPVKAPLQYFPIRPAFIKNVHLFFLHPFLTLGFVAFKVVQYTAAVSGFLATLFMKSKGSEKAYQKVYAAKK